MSDVVIIGTGTEQGKTVLASKMTVEEMRREIVRLRAVNAEYKKALAGIDITYAVTRNDSTVFINAHVTKEVRDLLWKIKEMRG